MTGNVTNGPGTAWRRRPDIDLTRVEEDGFIVEPDTQAVFHLNGLGRALWEALARPHTEDELAAAVVATFPDADADAIAGDVAKFLARLRKARLIERAE